MKLLKVDLDMLYCPKCGKPCAITGNFTMGVEVVINTDCVGEHFAYWGEGKRGKVKLSIPFKPPTTKTNKRAGGGSRGGRDE